MTNKKNILDRLNRLEQRKPLVLHLVYADGHTEKTTSLAAVLDAVCATPENGLVSVDWLGRDQNNLFSAMIESMDENVDDLSMSLYQMVDEAIAIGRLELPDLENCEMECHDEGCDDDERGTCIDDSERPDESSAPPLAAGGEICEAECEPMELCMEKPRNLI